MKKFFLSIILILVYLITNSVPLFPQDGYTIENLVNRALSKSKLIEVEIAKIEQAKGSQLQAGLWDNPLIDLMGGPHNRRDQNSLTNGTDIRLRISQNIALTNRFKTAKEIESQNILIREYNTKLAKQKIYNDVIYLIYAFKQTIIHTEHLKKRYERFSLIRQYLNSHPFYSPQKKIERELIQSTLLDIQKERLETLTQKELVWKQLNLYLDLDKEIDLEISWFNKGIDLNKNVLVSKMHSNNIALLIQETEVNRVKLEKKLATKNRHPDIQLGLNYEEQNYNDKANEKFVGAQIVVPIPIYNRNQGNIKQKDYEQKAILTQFEYLKKYLDSQLDIKFTEYNNKKAVLNIYNLNLENFSEQRMEFADKEFKKGRIDVLTYLAKEKSASDLHENIYEAQVKFIQTYLELLMLSGEMNFQTEKK